MNRRSVLLFVNNNLTALKNRGLAEVSFGGKQNRDKASYYVQRKQESKHVDFA